MSCFFTKYSQSIIAINLKKLILTITSLYFWLSMLSTQITDLLILELSHQIYPNLDWYGKSVFFLLDSSTTLDNLNHTKKSG